MKGFSCLESQRNAVSFMAVPVKGIYPHHVRPTQSSMMSAYGRKDRYNRRRKVNRSRPRAGHNRPYISHCLRL